MNLSRSKVVGFTEGKINRKINLLNAFEFSLQVHSSTVLDLIAAEVHLMSLVAFYWFL